MKYDDFIGKIQSMARLPSMGDAVAATRAVLETLSERLTADEIKDMASQLPSEIAYYLQRKAEIIDKYSLDEFFNRVSAREPVDLPVFYHARVVMSVLQEAVTKGEIDHLRAQLPDEFAPLFSGAEGEMRPAA